MEDSAACRIEGAEAVPHHEAVNYYKAVILSGA